jgi:hypothetical protein
MSVDRVELSVSVQFTLKINYPEYLIKGCLHDIYETRIKYYLSLNLWFSGLLYHVVWWLVTNVSEDRAASIFKVVVRGEREVEIDTGRYEKGSG